MVSLFRQINGDEEGKPLLNGRGKINSHHPIHSEEAPTSLNNHQSQTSLASSRADNTHQVPYNKNFSHNSSFTRNNSQNSNSQLTTHTETQIKSSAHNHSSHLRPYQSSAHHFNQSSTNLSKQSINYIHQNLPNPQFMNPSYPNQNGTNLPSTHQTVPQGMGAFPQPLITTSSHGKHLTGQSVQPPIFIQSPSILPHSSNMMSISRDSHQYSYPLAINPQALIYQSHPTNISGSQNLNNPSLFGQPFFPVAPNHSDIPQNSTTQPSHFKGSTSTSQASKSYIFNNTNESNKITTHEGFKNNLENTFNSNLKHNKNTEHAQGSLIKFDSGDNHPKTNKQYKSSLEKPMKEYSRGDMETSHSISINNNHPTNPNHKAPQTFQSKKQLPSPPKQNTNRQSSKLPTSQLHGSQNSTFLTNSTSSTSQQNTKISVDSHSKKQQNTKHQSPPPPPQLSNLNSSHASQTSLDSKPLLSSKTSSHFTHNTNNKVFVLETPKFNQQPENPNAPTKFEESTLKKHKIPNNLPQGPLALQTIPIIQIAAMTINKNSGVSNFNNPPKGKGQSSSNYIYQEDSAAPSSTPINALESYLKWSSSPFRRPSSTPNNISLLKDLNLNKNILSHPPNFKKAPLSTNSKLIKGNLAAISNFSETVGTTIEPSTSLSSNVLSEDPTNSNDSHLSKKKSEINLLNNKNLPQENNNSPLNRQVDTFIPSQTESRMSESLSVLSTEGLKPQHNTPSPSARSSRKIINQTEPIPQPPTPITNLVYKELDSSENLEHQFPINISEKAEKFHNEHMVLSPTMISSAEVFDSAEAISLSRSIKDDGNDSQNLQTTIHQDLKATLSVEDQISKELVSQEDKLLEKNTSKISDTSLEIPIIQPIKTILSELPHPQQPPRIPSTSEIEHTSLDTEIATVTQDDIVSLPIIPFDVSPVNKQDEYTQLEENKDHTNDIDSSLDYFVKEGNLGLSDQNNNIEPHESLVFKVDSYDNSLVNSPPESPSFSNQQSFYESTIKLSNPLDTTPSDSPQKTFSKEINLEDTSFVDSFNTNSFLESYQDSFSTNFSTLKDSNASKYTLQSPPSNPVQSSTPSSTLLSPSPTSASKLTVSSCDTTNASSCPFETTSPTIVQEDHLEDHSDTIISPSLSPVSNTITDKPSTKTSTEDSPSLKSSTQHSTPTYSTATLEEYSFDLKSMLSIFKILKYNGHFDNIIPSITLKSMASNAPEFSKKTLGFQPSKPDRYVLPKKQHTYTSPPTQSIHISNSNHISSTGTSLAAWRNNTTKEQKSILSPPQQPTRDSIKTISRLSKPMDPPTASVIPPPPEKPSLFGRSKKASSRLDSLRKEITGLLNKLTIEKFATITEKIALKCDEIETIAELEMFVDIVLNKAITQPNYCDMYADLCIVLRWRSKYNKLPREAKDFVYLMAVRIENDFSTFPSISFDASKEELEELNAIDREAAISLRKTKVLGTIQLLGRLITRKLVKYDIIEQEVERILLLPDPTTGKRPDEHLIECALEFYTSIGYYTYKNYTDDGIKNINRWQKCFKEHQESNYYSKRIFFKIQDFLDLSDNNWTRKTFREKAKTVAQIHEDAVADEKAGGAIISAQQGNYELIGLHDNQPYLAYLAKQHQLYKKSMEALNPPENQSNTPKVDPTSMQPPPPPPFSNSTSIEVNSPQSIKKKIEPQQPALPNHQLHPRNHSPMTLGKTSSLERSSTPLPSSYKYPSSHILHNADTTPSTINDNQGTTSFSFSVNRFSSLAPRSSNSSESFPKLNKKASNSIFVNSSASPDSIEPIESTTKELDLGNSNSDTNPLSSNTSLLSEKIFSALQISLSSDERNSKHFLSVWRNTILPHEISNQFLQLCQVIHDSALESPSKLPKLLEIASDLAKSISITSDNNENIFKLADSVLSSLRAKMLKNVEILSFFGEVCGCLLFHKLEHISQISLPNLRSCSNEDEFIEIVLSIRDGIMKRNQEFSDQFLKTLKPLILASFPNLTERALIEKIKQKSFI